MICTYTLRMNNFKLIVEIDSGSRSVGHSMPRFNSAAIDGSLFAMQIHLNVVGSCTLFVLLWSDVAFISDIEGSKHGFQVMLFEKRHLQVKNRKSEASVDLDHMLVSTCCCSCLARCICVKCWAKNVRGSEGRWKSSSVPSPSKSSFTPWLCMYRSARTLGSRMLSSFTCSSRGGGTFCSMLWTQ